MKLKRIKGNILSILLLLALLSLVLATPVFAKELNIEGKDLEFEVTPHDQNLINISNMAPGDSVTSKLTISNNFENAVEIYLRSERLDIEPPKGEPDLYKQIQMVVTLDGDIIHQGSMAGFASESILIDKFQPGEKQELVVEANLPGPETGNKFMGLSLSNQWIFTAEGDEIVIIDEDPPPMGSGEEDEGTETIEDEKVPIGKAKIPQTGGIPPELFFVAGAAIVTAGIVLKKKGE